MGWSQGPAVSFSWVGYTSATLGWAVPLVTKTLREFMNLQRSSMQTHARYLWTDDQPLDARASLWGRGPVCQNCKTTILLVSGVLQTFVSLWYHRHSCVGHMGSTIWKNSDANLDILPKRPKKHPWFRPEVPWRVWSRTKTYNVRIRWRLGWSHGLPHFQCCEFTSKGAVVTFNGVFFWTKVFDFTPLEFALLKRLAWELSRFLYSLNFFQGYLEQIKTCSHLQDGGIVCIFQGKKNFLYGSSWWTLNTMGAPLSAPSEHSPDKTSKKENMVVKWVLATGWPCLQHTRVLNHYWHHTILALLW